MTVFTASEFDAHEQVVFCHDAASGLKAIIALHDTRLGPALGGCRMWNYDSETAAVTDVLRLSKGMTYKNALAGLVQGGGKSVIIGDARTQKSPQMFQALGRFVDSLSGRYVVAEDVGTTVADMQEVAKHTAHVGGLPKAGRSGDPSPFTALGTFHGIRAAVKHKLGTDDLTGVRVAVQGLGNVGTHLCDYLSKAGAKLFVTDIHPTGIERAITRFGAKALAPDAIVAADVDVFAPCALGAVINDASLDQLKAGIVAGAANNQLAEDRHGEALRQRGVLYAPDYVINAGGVVEVVYGREGKSAEAAKAHTETIHDTLLEIFQRAYAASRPTSAVADEMARERLAAANEVVPAAAE